MKSHFTLHTGRHIGPGHPAYIIAEIGSNHDGSLERAKALIEAAKSAGADAVKIQSFQVQHLINRRWKPNGSWEAHKAWDILDKLTVPEEWHGDLQAHSQSVGIDFLSAPFDENRLALLAKLKVPAIKIASGDLTHEPLLSAVGQLGLPVILSTGLAYLGEVERALTLLSSAGCDEVAILHCVSLYPPQFKDMNIRAMATMGQAFHVPVGISDHTPGSVVPLGAVALGASVIEKHMTDDKSRPGPDHPYALNVEEFRQMVTDVRNLEAALGDGLKQPAPDEMGERIGARRGIYTARPVAQGAPITLADIKIVRHAYPEGLAPGALPQVTGKTAARALEADELLTWEMLT